MLATGDFRGKVTLKIAQDVTPQCHRPNKGDGQVRLRRRLQGDMLLTNLLIVEFIFCKFMDRAEDEVHKLAKENVACSRLSDSGDEAKKRTTARVQFVIYGHE